MTPEEQGKLIDEVDNDIERLNALYNQYFMGIEKTEPTVLGKNLERKVQLLRKEQIRNTALRFRFHMLVQKLNTQSTYWRRVCRQIEEGTYTRHVVRAQQRSGRPSTVPQTDEAQSQSLNEAWTLEDLEQNEHLDAGLPTPDPKTRAPTPQRQDMQLDDPFFDLTEPEMRSQQGSVRSHRNLLELDDPLDGAPPPSKAFEPRRPTPAKGEVPKDPMSSFFNGEPPAHKRPPALPTPPAPPTPLALPTPPAPPTPITAPVKKATGDGHDSGLSEERAKQVFKTYLAARQKTNEPMEGITFEKVRASLVKQHEAKGGKVDFKVVIRDGHAVIKAVNKE
ncbi:MAG: hypothetical protein MUC50_06785 [Myxococcota bacterium]|jgi:hypothetical protein|nr:hypothetical protein [Myxococcota bacterium]